MLNSMPIILQINVTANWGSTGHIANLCNEFASANGWECYEVFGRYQNPSDFRQIKIGNVFHVYEHYLEHLLFDNEGLASRWATHALIKKIRRIHPDIIHLHNIHDHWLNYKILFEYLNQTNIKVIWTFHDFWAITGNCSHFVGANCDKFKTSCISCPYEEGRVLPLLKRTNRNYELKKRLFTANKNLHIVAVSKWVEDNLKQSFLKDKDIRVIYNGVDTNIFKPTEYKDRLVPDNKFVIMSVSSQWKNESKGLPDYIELSKRLKDDEVIVLVGVTEEMKSKLPKGIIGISRTNNQAELAALYSRADVISSFSNAETFGLTIVEGYSCGTPAVVYENTALPALIFEDTGYVVPNRNVEAAYEAMQKIKINGKSYYSEACIKIAHKRYKKEKCYNEYLTLYEELLNDNTHKLN